MPVVMRARELCEAGWTPTEAARILAEEGVSVTHHTIRRWVNPESAERVSQRVRDNHRAGRWRRPWTFKLGGNKASAEYQAAFVARLRDEGVTWQNVARCCRVVFGGRYDSRKVQDMYRRHVAREAQRA